MHKNLRRWGTWGLLATVLSFGGCQGDTAAAKGQLMLVVQSDMSLPKDVDEVRIEVLVYGSLIFGNSYTVGSGNLSIPATFALVEGKSASVPVTVRVLGRQQQKTRTLREVVTTVPANRIAALRVPISWLCDGFAKDTGFQQAETTCGDGQTCVAGTCVPREVDSTLLPSFTPEAVFGGTPTPGDGTCFDVQTCFRQAANVTDVDFTTCTARVPSGASPTLNFALATSTGWAANGGAGGNPAGRSADGICSEANSDCLVPLDFDTTPEGWSWTDASAKTVRLPAGVCAKLREKKATSLRATTLCDAKTPSVPACGPWSSVRGDRVVPAGNASGISSPAGGGGGGGGTSGSGGSGLGQGGNGALSCAPGRKACNGQCVALADPRFGCDFTSCTPCPVDHMTCQLNRCAPSGPVIPNARPLLTDKQPQPGVGSLLVPSNDKYVYWTTVEGVRAVEKTGGVAQPLVTTPPAQPYQKAGALQKAPDGTLLWLADGKLFWKQTTVGQTEDGAYPLSWMNPTTQATFAANVNDDFPFAVVTPNELVWTWAQQGWVLKATLAAIESGDFSTQTIPYPGAPERGRWGLTWLPGNGQSRYQNVIFWANHETGKVEYGQLPSVSAVGQIAPQAAQGQPRPRALAVNDQYFCQLTEPAPAQLACLPLSSIPMPPAVMPGNAPRLPGVDLASLGAPETLVLDGNQAYVAGSNGILRVNVTDQTTVRLTHPTANVKAFGVDATSLYWAEQSGLSPTGLPQYSLNAVPK